MEKGARRTWKLQALEVRWRDSGRKIMVAQEKHISKWELVPNVTEIPLGEDDKSPSNVVARGPKKEQCQCGRDELEVKKEKLHTCHGPWEAV